jgi:hypothetical protein
MTLDEIILSLKEARQQAGQDIPCRMVVRTNEGAEQFDCIDARLDEGLHGKIVLVLGGQVAAVAHGWPGEPGDDS